MLLIEQTVTALGFPGVQMNHLLLSFEAKKKKNQSCVIKLLLQLVLRTLRFFKYLLVQNYVNLIPFFS